MGELDSSKTRVQPVFGALADRDPSGRSWLPTLVRMGSRGEPPEEPGTLEQEPRFEFSADPPRDFLRWLIENPSVLRQPTYAVSKTAAAKREAFFSGDAAARAEALAGVDDPDVSHRRKWWTFEGTTMVDCALFTERLVLFVEGKRTEAGASRAVSWYEARNQVLRNLDCARWWAKGRGRDYYAMLVVERADADDPRLMAAASVVTQAVVESSLPHLSSTEREELMQHYLGYTTWHDLVETFDLPPRLLA